MGKTQKGAESALTVSPVLVMAGIAQRILL